MELIRNTIMEGECVDVLSRLPDKSVDLVFADPPYGKGFGTAALLSAREGGWLVPGALCVVEEVKTADFAAPEGFEELDRRRYRDTDIVFMKLE